MINPIINFWMTERARWGNILFSRILRAILWAWFFVFVFFFINLKLVCTSSAPVCRRPSPMEAGRTRTESRFASFLFSVRRSVIIAAVSMKARAHPSSLFATTALVLLASSLVRAGQRPYLSYLCPESGLPPPLSFCVTYLPYLSRLPLCLPLALRTSFTLLSLSLNVRHSSTRLALISSFHAQAASTRANL